ncbi:hypothetical protein [Streptomyces sp. NPDC057253]|uniref:hypothetical protein n=1 Tax=Streptomyces sp. NPDC057253 TaxID=3346069 RepID=UPI00363554F8
MMSTVETEVATSLRQLAPTDTVRRPGSSRTRGRGFRWRRALVLGTLVLAVLASVFSAYADPSPVPSPGPAPAPTTSTDPTPAPSDKGFSCPTSDCIPQPSTPSSPASTPRTLPPPEVPEGDGTGGISGWIAKGISGAITGFFKSVISGALNPLLDLLSDTLLTTPSPSSLPRVGELWTNSWQIALACYASLIAVAGIVVMGHETVQTRHSIKEIAPRIPLAFIAAALSLFLTGKAVDLANALSRAAMSGGVDADTAGPALRNFVLSAFSSGNSNIFLNLVWLVVIGVLVALLLTFVVRVTLTIILVVAAPLALICHVLPQTDGVARWWWRAFGGVLAVQVAQSLALITGARVFLSPGDSGVAGLFGLDDSGLVNVLITLALMYIVFKIPFWILGSVRLGHGRSFVGSAVRSYVMYKTFGFLRGSHAGRTASVGGAGRTPPSAGPSGPALPPRPSNSSPPSGGSGRNMGGTPSRSTGSPGSPTFLPPIRPVAGQSTPLGPAAGPPPLPTFQAPGAGASNEATRWPRPARPPGRPTFQAPGAASPTPPVRMTVRPPLPTHPHFEQSTSQPRVPPRRAAQPPPPAAFRPPVGTPPAGTVRGPSTSVPPPTTFRSPLPSQRRTRRSRSGEDRS